MASGGWLGLSRRHGRRGARRNRGVAPAQALCKILTMPPHRRQASSTVLPPCPAHAGTVASGQSPIPSGIAPIPSCTPPPMAFREAEPPSGGHRRPPGGSESLRKILTMPPHGLRASSTVTPPCPALAGTVASGCNRNRTTVLNFPKSVALSSSL